MFKKVFSTIVEWQIRSIPGGIGQRIRYAYYKRRLGGCGKNVRIEEWVIFQNPENIFIGDDVWIFSHSVLTAPNSRDVELNDNKHVMQVASDEADASVHCLRIGNEVQIGLYSVLNGVGGLEIGDCVTLSANVAIYSATHVAYSPADRMARVGANGMVRSLPVFSKQRAIRIGDGVWLGLSVCVICAEIGRDAFIHSGAVVASDVAPNTVAAGNPVVSLRKRYVVADEAVSKDL
jgi:acetyltransferase-like isoleucine patch superfamily enzyme